MEVSVLPATKTPPGVSVKMSSRYSAPVWLLFRAVIGLLFTFHGAATVFGVFGGQRGAGQPADFGSWPDWWAGMIQLLCGGLVATGLGTRVAALLCSGSMAYAYFIVHQPHGLLPIENGGVSAALYSWSFLIIAALGAGPWSLDAVLRRRRVGATSAPDQSAGHRDQPAPAT